MKFGTIENVMFNRLNTSGIYVQENEPINKLGLWFESLPNGSLKYGFPWIWNNSNSRWESEDFNFEISNVGDTFVPLNALANDLSRTTSNNSLEYHFAPRTDLKLLIKNFQGNIYYEIAMTTGTKFWSFSYLYYVSGSTISNIWRATDNLGSATAKSFNAFNFATNYIFDPFGVHAGLQDIAVSLRWTGDNTNSNQIAVHSQFLSRYIRP